MDELIHYTMLYDIYGELLTTKQQNYFEEYYFKNLSLSELATKYEISRNAVHKNLKDTINKLENYESKLHISLKTKKLEELKEIIEDKSLKNKIQEVIEI